MIATNGPTGFPVKGVQFDGRTVFIEVRPGDEEKDLLPWAYCLMLACRMFADLNKPNLSRSDVRKIVAQYVGAWQVEGLKMTVQKKINAGLDRVVRLGD